MNCKGVQSRLSAYIDCELTGSEMLQLRAHLSECRTCASEETQLRTLKNLLSNGPQPEPTADFEDRLVRHVYGSRLAEGRMKTRSSGNLRFVTAAAAAAVLTFAAASMLGENKPTTTADVKQELHLASDQAYFSGTDPLMGSSVVPINYAGR